MRIKQPGKIVEDLWFLGCEESCVYLLQGERESMIISGGMSYLVPYLLRQFEAFGIDAARLTKILILHSHFDHVGIVPFFKRRYPQMEVYASPRVWDILSMPKAVTSINELNRAVSKRMGNEKVYASYDLDWRDDIKGRFASEGTLLDLGGLEILIYNTPGHSSCSIAAYVPKLKALFASDSGGIPYKQMILTFGISHFTMYQESLEKIKHLEVEYICADHYGYLAGDEANNFIYETINSAKEHRALLERAFLRTGDIEAAAQNLVNDFYKDNPDFFLAPEISVGIYRQMVRHVVQAMGVS